MFTIPDGQPFLGMLVPAAQGLCEISGHKVGLCVVGQFVGGQVNNVKNGHQKLGFREL